MRSVLAGILLILSSNIAIALDSWVVVTLTRGVHVEMPDDAQELNMPKFRLWPSTYQGVQDGTHVYVAGMRQLREIERDGEVSRLTQDVLSEYENTYGVHFEKSVSWTNGRRPFTYYKTLRGESTVYIRIERWRNHLIVMVFQAAKDPYRAHRFFSSLYME